MVVVVGNAVARSLSNMRSKRNCNGNGTISQVIVWKPKVDDFELAAERADDPFWEVGSRGVVLHQDCRHLNN